MLGDNLDYALRSGHNKFFLMELAGVTPLWIQIGLPAASSFNKDFPSGITTFLDNLLVVTKC